MSGVPNAGPHNPLTPIADSDLDAIVDADPRSAAALADVTGFGAITSSLLDDGIRAALDHR